MSWAVAALVAVSALALAALRQERDATRSWADAANELEFQWTRNKHRLRMLGSVKGASVRMTATPRDQASQGAAVRLVFTPESPLHQEAKVARGDELCLPWLEDVAIGDPELDGPFFLDGPRDPLAAMLNAEAREVLEQLRFASSVVVAHGTIDLEFHFRATRERLVEAVRCGEALSREVFWRSRNVPERLYCSARDDPHPSVRRTNLRQLLLHHGETDYGERGARIALEGDADLRVLGASALGAEGTPLLGAMVRNPTMPDEARLHALERGMNRGDFDAQLERSLQECQGEVLSAVVERVATTRSPELRRRLSERAVGVSGVGAIGFCRAFGHLADTRAEPHLLRWLEDASTEVQAEAAAALAHAGTTRAVQPLLEGTGGLLRTPQLKSAARHAVQMIQARMRHTDVGDVSLATPDDGGGELSLATPAGELTLADRGDS